MSTPVAVPQLLVAFGFSLSKPKQVILVGERGEDLDRMLGELRHDVREFRIVGWQRRNEFLRRLFGRPVNRRWVGGTEGKQEQIPDGG